MTTPSRRGRRRRRSIKIIKTIKGDKAHHAKAFKRMKRDMFVAMWGREETWSEKNYKANLAGRHVKQKTATLYAKNPKATAKRAERLDFAVWDEDPQSIMLAMQAMQQNAVAEQQHAQPCSRCIRQLCRRIPIAASVMMGHNGGPPDGACSRSSRRRKRSKRTRCWPIFSRVWSAAS
jgi:hypothetical protein